jgi:hypothetical protein
MSPTYKYLLKIVSPESKHIGTPGITSILEHGYELLTGLAYIVRS